MKASCLLFTIMMMSGPVGALLAEGPTSLIQGIENSTADEKSRAEVLQQADAANRMAATSGVRPVISALEPAEGLGSVRVDAAHTAKPSGEIAAGAVIQQVTPAYVRGDKPTAPIQVSLKAGTAYPNGSQDLLVTVVPTAPAAKLAVQVHGSEGLKVGSGSVDFNDAAKLWTPVQQTILLRKNGDGRRLLTVTSTLEYADSPPQTAVDTYLLNPQYHGTGAEKPTDPLGPGMRIRLDPSKFKVLEVPAQTGGPGS